MKKVFAFWRIICFLIIISLSACGTMHFGSTDTPIEIKPYQPKVKEVRVAKESENPTEKYGRFTVELLPNGERKIYGGVFMPEAELSFWSDKKHVVTANYTTKELAYYKRGLGGYEPVIGYAVVTPSPDTLPKDVVRGTVIRIDTAPTWCPTPNIRRAMPYLPAGCLPYRHPLNAMGEVKFEIKWDVKGWELHRIHGAEGYADNGRFWEIGTSGCIRVQNQAILNLVELLGPDVNPKDIEVIVFR